MSSQKLELDRIDRKLLRELDLNSRQSFVTLSRTLRIPAETVRYRLNSLLERKIIDRFITLIDSGKLGNTYYKVLLKLFNVSEVEVRQIIDDLVSHDAVNWIARTDGIFDIAFTIRVRQVAELSKFIDKLKQDYRRYIQRITFAINIEVEFCIRDYLVGEKRIGSGVTYTSPTSAVEVDKTDIAILQILGNNTRIPATEIASRLDLSSETVAQRILKLERGHIITRYTILPNLSNMKMINYYVFLYLSSASRQRILEFIEFCRNEVHIAYFIKALGEWDYELNIEVDTLAKYREIMMSLTRSFSDIIRDYIGLPVAGIYKYTIAP